MAQNEDQQFCLRWNNFQANITSQFETLREDEDFTDVTIACEGHRLQAHKVVLSACSPFFKELFKTNPCSHPIIFMRDVEAQHIVALMEFMYAGEVNVAQAHLPMFLKTAESLRIRGLTDTESAINTEVEVGSAINGKQTLISSSSTVTSSQDISDTGDLRPASPLAKKPCKSYPESVKSRSTTLHPKVEIPEYSSGGEDDGVEDHDADGFQDMYGNPEAVDFAGSVDYFSPQTGYSKDLKMGTPGQDFTFFRHSMGETWPSPGVRTMVEQRRPTNLLSTLHNQIRNNRLVKLADGIEIREEQLQSVKWSDFRKLTRGLAAILFSPQELASCSVTGQRWSRAGSFERPVKPALNRAKVQAIISYVATRFPMVEISRIKQVLAYKCKENSTAFKMKAVRLYRDPYCQ